MSNGCLRIGWVPVVCLLLAGCSSPERNMLIGQWQLEKAGKISSRIGNPPNEMTDDWSTEDYGGRMLIVFHSSGKLETISQLGAIDRNKTGSWELLSYDRSTRMSQVRCVLNDQTTEHEIDWLDNGNMKMVPPNMAGTLTKLEFSPVQ